MKQPIRNKSVETKMEKNIDQRPAIAIENASYNEDKLSLHCTERNLTEILALTHRWHSSERSTSVHKESTPWCNGLVEIHLSEKTEAKL